MPLFKLWGLPKIIFIADFDNYNNIHVYSSSFLANVENPDFSGNYSG